MERGIRNVLKGLKMITGDITIVDSAVFLVNEQVITSTVDGLFYSVIKCGQTIKKGALLGYVTDYFGNRITDFYSPISGIVLMSYVTPVVNTGEDLFWLSETKKRFEIL
jgi:predicted deacylase